MGERRETRACRYKVPSINSRSSACNGVRRGDFERGQEKERGARGTEEEAKGRERKRVAREEAGVPHQADNPREARVAHSR